MKTDVLIKFVVAGISFLLFSCVREEVQQKQYLSGIYARDDGSGITAEYFRFEGKNVELWKANSKKTGASGVTYMDNILWGMNDDDTFKIMSSQSHSLEGERVYSAIFWEETRIKDDALYVGENRYTLVKGMKEEYYSSISTEPKSFVYDYTRQKNTIPVTVTRPIPGGALSADKTAEWITDLGIENGSVSFSLGATSEDRSTTLIIHYTNAEDISVAVSQEPSTFIRLEQESMEVGYSKNQHRFSYSIENPLVQSMLHLSCDQQWAHDFKVEGKIVSFTVDENNSGESRTAKITLSYEGARDICLSLTQTWSAPSLTVSPISQDVDYSGGSFFFEYSIENPQEGTACMVSTQDKWITDVSISRNKVSYKVAENNTGTQRTGKIKLNYGSYASVEFQVNQSWSATTITLTPTSQEVTYMGGSFSFAFSIANPHEGTSCTASTQNTWITDVSISGNKVSYKVSGNDSGSQRFGKIKLSYGTYASAEFQVNQSWSATSITLTPTSQEVTYKGGSFSFAYSIANPHEGTSCTASTQNTWITDVDISGNIVSYKVSENNTDAQRSGKIKLSYGTYVSVEFLVNQSWAATTITLTPTSQEVTYTGGSFSFEYSVSNPREGTSCTASTQDNWITDVTISVNKVSYKVSENPPPGSARLGKIKLNYGTYDSVEFLVKQSSEDTTIILMPTSQEVTYKGGSFDFAYFIPIPVEGTDCTASTQDKWITDVTLSGCMVSYKVSENNTGSQRSGKIKLTYGTYASAEFQVNQAWAASTITLTPTSQAVSYTGGSFSFAFSIENPREGTSCTATTQDAWITDVGIAGNKVSYKVSENNTGAQRSGKIKLSYGTYASVEFLVNQSCWAASIITLTQTSQEVTYTGGTFSFGFSIENPREGVTLKAVPQAEWITDVKISGSTITYKVEPSTSDIQRESSIRLSYLSTEKDFIIIQDRYLEMVLSSSEREMYQGGRTKIHATVNGEKVNVQWRSSNESIVTVNSDGVVNAVNLGEAKLTATLDNQSASCQITVIEAPLCLECPENQSGKILLVINSGCSISYQKNDEEIIYCDSNTEIDVVSGDQVWLFGNNTTTIGAIGTRGPFYVFGNIMSLMKDGRFWSSYEFKGLFSYAEIRNHPTINLQLPATSLTFGCYMNMFKECTALTSAPALPATSLTSRCYMNMFEGCTALTSAPELPATSLAEQCYSGMFGGCKSLTSAPVLPATILATACYDNMFRKCVSLTTAPALPATSLASGCYRGMFNGCTALTSAPALPATSLARYCYHAMFYGCKSLTSAPALPATSLAEGCYQSMFEGSTALTSAPALPATSLAPTCYLWMFSKCVSLTTAPVLPATILAEECYYGMFYGCKSLTSAPALPATSLAEKCYAGMFRECTALTSAPALPATSLAEQCYSGMFLECTALTSAPALPATSLAEGCYYHMFYYCENLRYVKALFTDYLSSCTSCWLEGVSSDGVFVKNSAATWDIRGSSGIPDGWVVETASE